MPTTLSKVTAKTAAEICALMSLDEEATALLKDDHSPAEFLDVLTQNERLPDAIRFLACALPPREAVQWAWQCVRELAPPAKKPEPTAALAAIEKWIKEPSDANRRAALEAARKAEGTAAGLAGAAAFFSEGSMAPPDQPAADPPAGVAGSLAGGSILIAAVAQRNPKRLARNTSARSKLAGRCFVTAVPSVAGAKTCYDRPVGPDRTASLIR